MTYLAGLGGFGRGTDRDPQIVCDGCGLVYRLRADRAPPVWFLDKKAPPGWKKTIDKAEDGARSDYCPRCKEPKR